MMSYKRGKDEVRTIVMLKKHKTLEAAIANYSETVNSDLKILVRGRVRLRVLPIDKECARA